MKDKAGNEKEDVECNAREDELEELEEYHLREKLRRRRGEGLGGQDQVEAAGGGGEGGGRLGRRGGRGEPPSRLQGLQSKQDDKRRNNS